MARVRQIMRQPVTSLWQSESERASTAPARVGLAANISGFLNLPAATGSLPRSRIRPRSQLATMKNGSSNNSEARILATAGGRDRGERGGNGYCSRGGGEADGTGGAGRAVTAASGHDGRSSENHGESGVVSAADGCRSSFVAPQAPTCGSMVGTVVDGSGSLGRGRRIPMPLRSSHRVGPVGSLGERSLPQNGCTPVETISEFSLVEHCDRRSCTSVATVCRQDPNTVAVKANA